MGFEWAEFLRLAEYLRAINDPQVSPEAAQRSAVSRAYYGAFGRARDTAQARDGFVSRRGPEDHGRLRDHFRTRREHQLAQRLDRLRQWRNQCDYDADVERLGEVVAAAVTTARDVVNRL